MVTTIFVISTIIVILAVVENIYLIITTRDLQKQQKLEASAKHQRKMQSINTFIDRLQAAKTLREIYMLHIIIWANDIRHENFGPNEYGMFRTSNILLMTPEEVYLGNIWGLNTLKLTQWENQSPDDQKLVIEQYRNHLINNLTFLKRDGTK